MAVKKQRTWWFIGAVALQVGILVAILYREHCFISETYTLQRLEKEKHTLLAEHAKLAQLRASQMNRNRIQEYAENTLQFRPVKLKSVRSLYE